MLWAANPPPLISITAPAAGASILGPTPIVLEAAASSPDSTIASITFFNGKTKLGVSTGTSSPYAFTWKAVQPGSYSVTAVAKDALGVSATSAAVAVTVAQDPAPVVTLTAAPKSGPMLIGPATVLLSATATSADEAIASVSFFDGSKKLGTSASTASPLC